MVQFWANFAPDRGQKGKNVQFLEKKLEDNELEIFNRTLNCIEKVTVTR